jgi:hypothetical protein
MVPDSQYENAIKRPARKTMRAKMVVVSPMEKVDVWQGMQIMLLAGKIMDTAPT